MQREGYAGAGEMRAFVRLKPTAHQAVRQIKPHRGVRSCSSHQQRDGEPGVVEGFQEISPHLVQVLRNGVLRNMGPVPFASPARHGVDERLCGRVSVLVLGGASYMFGIGPDVC